MAIKRNLLKYLPIVLGLSLLLILTYWYFSYYRTTVPRNTSGYPNTLQIGGVVSNEVSTMSSADSNQATKQVESVLRNFENNYRIFQEDNQRVSSLFNNGISAADYSNALSYLNDVATRNNNFLQDMSRLRAIENDIAKTYGQPLFASISEKVTQAENIINDSNAKIAELQRRILSYQPVTAPIMAPTVPTVETVPVVPTVPSVVPTVPAVVPALPTVTVEEPIVPVVPALPTVTPTVPIIPTVPVQTITPTVPSVPAVITPTVPITTPAVITTPTVPITSPIVSPPVITTPTVVTDDSDIRAVVVPTVTPVSAVTPVPPAGWPNQIPILVPGQVVSQIPNPIVPSRFNNFAMESQALTAAASTMGAVSVRPDRINCLSSMQYYAPISSPGYPPPQPVISGSY